MAEYMKERYFKRRLQAIELLGSKCVDCESLEFLEFDHADASAKEFNIAKRLASSPWPKILSELEKCVLRCNECHTAKSVKYDLGSVEHGEGLTGKRNCYCELCSPLKKEYNKNWKLALKGL